MFLISESNRGMYAGNEKNFSYNRTENLPERFMEYCTRKFAKSENIRVYFENPMLIDVAVKLTLILTLILTLLLKKGNSCGFL